MALRHGGAPVLCKNDFIYALPTVLRIAPRYPTRKPLEVLAVGCNNACEARSCAAICDSSDMSAINESTPLSSKVETVLPLGFLPRAL